MLCCSLLLGCLALGVSACTIDDGYLPTLGPMPKDGYKLPLLPSFLPHFKNLKHYNILHEWEKKIPRNVWVAVRNSSDELPAHSHDFMAKNKDWNYYFCGNTEKDYFMNKYFYNTSTLWAYNALNPLLGTAKSELWRLAVLYTFGGMYIDDDANIGTPLNDIVLPNDQVIMGKEAYNYTDSCYIDSYRLSNTSLIRKYGEIQKSDTIFDNKFFFNWCLFSAPRHEVILKSLEYGVELIKNEYLLQSQIKLAASDHKGKVLMCCTTFPIYYAAREIEMTGRSNTTGLRIGGFFFQEYGGNMKAWLSDNLPDHWVKSIGKHNVPYLHEYSTNFDALQNTPIQAPGAREIFLVVNGTRRGFPDIDTFIGMKFDFSQVKQVHHIIVQSIPQGDPLPHLSIEE